MDIVIGLEVHAQLATRTKIFCGCATAFGMPPNSQVCPVCTGMPGVLPVLNRKAFELAMRAVLALEGKVNPFVKFDRKNYFYPDLPKNYQISQYDMPLGSGGVVEISTQEGTKKIHLTRVHLEEDAGKLIHDQAPGQSLVDFNRSGVPLIEIVSEPEIRSPEEAYQYLGNLKAILKATGVSDVDMEKGQLRCDANISLRPKGDSRMGVKVELKNLNSFKYVRLALEYEAKRQSGLLDQGEAVIQETRLWDEATGKTLPMRAKEEAHDYRYSPEPDLVPFVVDKKWIEEVRSSLPELPKEKKARFMKDYGLSEYDASVLLQDEDVASFYADAAAGYRNYKNLANWVTGTVMAYWNETGGEFRGLHLDRGKFVELLNLVDQGKISQKVGREEVFPEFARTGKSPTGLVEEKSLLQISDEGALEGIMDKVIQENPRVAQEYQEGKEKALQFLVGQIMRQTKGKANPHVVNKVLQKKLRGGGRPSPAKGPK